MPIELAMWANLQAEYAGWLILVSGILGAAVNFRTNEIAYYAIVMSLVVILFEWPRSKRQKGTSIPRWHQEILEPALQAIGPIGSNYFIRFFLYLCACIPLFFLLPTMLAGMCLFCASVTYFAAGLRGERWAAISGQDGRPTQTQQKRTVVSDAPTHPPPRGPPK